MTPLDRTEATNRLRVAYALADGFALLIRRATNTEPTPAEVLAYAETAVDADWRAVEAMAGRDDRPASEATRTATLTVLATRAAEADEDPFASFGRDRTR